MAGERLVVIGDLGAAHGVRGEIRLRPFNPDSPTPGEVAEVFVLGGEPRRLRLRRARRHGRAWLLSLDGFDDPERARSLRGRAVAVREVDLAPRGESEYYYYQLVGLEVRDEEGRVRGRVREVLPSPGNDVLAVEADGREHLVPLVEAFVREVDIAAGRIVIRAVEGLFS